MLTLQHEFPQPWPLFHDYYYFMQIVQPLPATQSSRTCEEDIELTASVVSSSLFLRKILLKAFQCNLIMLKLMFSKKATKISEIFTVDLTLCSKCQIDGEEFINFSGLLRKNELYRHNPHSFLVLCILFKKQIFQQHITILYSSKEQQTNRFWGFNKNSTRNEYVLRL